MRETSRKQRIRINRKIEKIEKIYNTPCKCEGMTIKMKGIRVCAICHKVMP